MKHYYFITFFLLSTFSFGEFNYHLELASYQVTPNIQCFFGLQSEATEINGANVINTCYITTTEGYVVIDSGPTYHYAEQAYMIMQHEKKLPVKYVINTSSNELNVLGNQFYKEHGAVLVGPKYYKTYAEKSQPISLQNKISQEAFENTNLIPLHIPLNKNKTITLGSTIIKIKKVESKEARNLLVYLPQSKTIFVGNFISQTPSLVKKEHESNREWARNFNIIEKLSWRYIIPSHGVKIDKRALAVTKDYLKPFQKRIKKTKPKTVLAKKEKPTPKKVVAKKVVIKKEKKNIPCVQYTDYQRAKQLAIKAHKYVLIKYETDNCSPCAKLDREIKRNEHLREMIVKNIEAVKINQYRGDQTTDFDIFVAPTVIVFNPETKKILIRLEGTQTFKKLEYKLSRLLKKSPKYSSKGNFLAHKEVYSHNTDNDSPLHNEQQLLYSSLLSPQDAP